MRLATTDLIGLLTRSRDLIRASQRPGGAYPASEAFPAYRGYCWLRDGAFIADAMSSAGEVGSAGAFFDWCAATIEARRDRIGQVVEAARAGRPLPDRDMLPTRFRFDGRDGDDDWWDFQLDGYGTWVWAAAAHARRHGLQVARWGEAMR
ncbi:MAG: glycoside hydrolase family 15, partial [Actinomycetia bacterium]|nr:glycoside hydrolase family 15 [Actinomycetes bacterium]